MMSALAHRITDQIVRHVSDLRLPLLNDAAEAAAFRILADPDIAAGLRATTTLAAIDARHQPRTWGDSDVRVCTSCQTAYPCTDRVILDGQPEQTPAVAR